MKKILFTNIPKQCELLKNQIEDETITKIYSDLKFIYFPFPIPNQAANEDENKAFVDQIKTFIFKFLINFRFFTFYISNIIDPTKQSLTNLGPTYFEGQKYLDFNSNSYSEIVNAIITCEKICLIIEKIPISIFLHIIEAIKKLEISIINVTDNQNKVEIREEIKSFCDQFKSINNDFVKLTIPSISCYFIRRFYYPTCYFNDPSFLKSNEFEIKIRFEGIFYCRFTSEIDFIKLMKKYTNMMKITNQEEHKEIKIQDFQSKDFIKLRLLFGDEKKLIYLAFHLKDLRIYMMKIAFNQDSKEENFCKNFSHRCCRKFHGFLFENNNKIGFIYEFMSNGTLDEFLQKQSIDNTYIIMTIIRLFQGIDYFHSNSLVHRDLKPSNILIDNDFVPYISDFDVIRHVDNEPMTIDIGSSLYTSPEQDSRRNFSYPTDIYSFGLIIYFLYEKNNLLSHWNKNNEDEQIPLISKATKNIQDIFQSCLQFNPEKRMERKEIKSKLINEINSFSYLEDYFIQNGNELQTKILIQYLIESIFIQIDNEDISNYFYYNKLFYFYAPFYFKSKGRYGDAYLVIGEYYSQGRFVTKDYSKSIKFYELSAKYNNSTALLYIGLYYENGDGVEQDYLKAIEFYKLSAKLQNSNAFLNLGVLYDKGIGVNQDYKKAKEYFEESAKLGNSTALFNLGTIYLYGKGVEINDLKAIEFFELSAKQGNKNALFNLGRIYMEGLGVEKNYLKAFEYFEQSAKLNNLNALLNLGIFYENGFGVKQDYEIAKKYYEYCAKEKNAEAYFNLGNLYFKGLGVEKDFKIAFEFFELSAKGKSNKALLFLGKCYEKGNVVKQDYQKAKEYYELSVEQGNSEAYCKLGLMFQNGLGVKQNYLKAKEYFELSANKKNSNAFLYLGILYFEGFGVDKNYLKAKEFFEKSAKLNNESALFNLGNIYFRGLGVDQNYYKAKEYYELSAKQGNSLALLNLGTLYEKGHGVRQDYLKAKEYYELSSEKGNLKATINLGTLYENGRGVKQNYLKAKECFEIAAKKNDPKAFLLLGNLYSDGHGVEQNYLEAIKYYELSAKQNESKAFVNLGYLYEKGLGVSQDKNKALDLYEKAANLGDSGGLLNMGFIYCNERKNYKAAIKCYELAAKQNNSTALLNLGNLYEQGIGVEKNYTKAKEYYELSAKLNDSSAYLYLGNLYEYGNGVEKNYLKAKEYYLLAAQLKNSDAIACLGFLYEKGLGVQQNISKAISYYELAEKQNNALALFLLGNLYSNGEFFDIDLKKSENYFLKCFNTYNNEVITYSSETSFYSISSSYNFYRFISLNDLGLLYHTILQDEEKAFKFIKESAFAEYPFAQNNLGLNYQLYLNEIGNAEHFYQRSSANNFALADFNLGQMKEKENKIQESIGHFIKASSHEDQPLLYKEHYHYDKRLEISKTFILCFMNLKIALYFLNFSKFDESRKYFVKSFAKLNLINDEITYKFEFHFIKSKRKNIFSYFKNFILLHLLFNLKNQPYSQITDFINNLHLDDEDNSIEDKDENNNEEPITDTESHSDHDEEINDSENKSEFIYESGICNHSENIEPMNAEPDNDNNDDKDDEIIFDNPGNLFDFIIKSKNLIKNFIDEIKEILQIIEELLYIPPYPILFGRISIQKPKQKQINQNNPFIKDIDESFHDGFGF